MIQALLLQPPPGDLTGPYPALPYIKAHAEKEGYKVMVKDLGIEDIFGELEQKSLLIYGYARDYAKHRGIIIADTKFEFGFINGQLTLIDELLTPDSSRFWDASQYEVAIRNPALINNQSVIGFQLQDGIKNRQRLCYRRR